MVWTRSFWLRLQSFFLHSRISQRLDGEFQFHLDQQIAENIAAGMTPDEARHAAMRTFGNPGYLKEETRESWSWMWLENFLRDLRYAARVLARTPAFSIVAILVIALGIGATTSLFTVVRSVLLKPLPFKDQSQLIRLYEHDAQGKFPYNVVSGGVFGE
jgi:hypothetical protein